jgi:hypothetical protein
MFRFSLREIHFFYLYTCSILRFAGVLEKYLQSGAAGSVLIETGSQGRR